MTSAEQWLDNHGLDEGTQWMTADGQRMGDALEESDAEPCTVWVGHDDPYDPTAVSAYLWPDGSGVLLTDGWWDLIRPGAPEHRTECGPLYTNDELDALQAAAYKRIREILGTQAEVADALGLSHYMSLAKREQGSRRISREAWLAIRYLADHPELIA